MPAAEATSARPRPGAGGIAMADDNRIRHATLPARLTSPAPAGRVYGYARVSTVMQADEGESLDVQQRTIAGYAQMHGLAVERVFVERGVSGSKPLGDRPQGAALLAGAASPATW